MKRDPGAASAKHSLKADEYMGSLDDHRGVYVEGSTVLLIPSCTGRISNDSVERRPQDWK